VFSYDSHIELNMYPFLDNKEEFAYTSLAEDVAKPRCVCNQRGDAMRSKL
jgi:hypothetical protein